MSEAFVCAFSFMQLSGFNCGGDAFDDSALVSNRVTNCFGEKTGPLLIVQRSLFGIGSIGKCCDVVALDHPKCLQGDQQILPPPGRLGYVKKLNLNLEQE